MKQLIKWLLFWVILSLVFISTAVFLLCYANGYRINWKAKKIQKTGLVIVKSYPSKADVFFDGHEIGKAPLRISYVLPGQHDVSLKLEDHQEWNQTVSVEETMALSIEADLFYSQPIIKDYIGQAVDYSLPEKPSIKNDSELWDKKSLVTRFSRPVLDATWAKDRRSIIYQIDNEIRVISSDGLHDFLLAKLSSSEIVDLYPKSDYELIYKDSSGQKLVQFRDKVNWSTNIQYLNFKF